MNDSLHKLTKYTNYLLGSLLLLLGAHLVWANAESQPDTAQTQSSFDVEKTLIPTAHADIPAGDNTNTGDCGDGGGGGGCGG